MNDRAKVGGGDARASDRDRQRIADDLRIHWAEGRLDVEQLEHRLEQTMSASTIQELAELVDDLPRVTVSDPIEPSPG